MKWAYWKSKIFKLFPLLFIFAIIFLIETRYIKNLLISFIIFVLLFVSYKVYINWAMFMSGVRLMESMIWGVSQDKENKEILKHTKVVWKWKKKELKK